MPELDKKEITEVWFDETTSMSEEDWKKIALTLEQRKSLRGAGNPFWEHRDGLD